MTEIQNTCLLTILVSSNVCHPLFFERTGQKETNYIMGISHYLRWFFNQPVIFWRRCTYQIVKLSKIDKLLSGSNSCVCISSDLWCVIASFFFHNTASHFSTEQGPVKASIYYSTESHTTYSGFVDYIKGRSDYNNPPRVEYLNDFSWYLSSPWDHVGIRLQAAFRAQETGEYTFTIQGDDYGVMYIHSCMTCTDYVRVARFTISQCFNCPT